MDATGRWREVFSRPGLVVGCDTQFAPLALGTILSAADGCRERGIDLLIYDAGLTDRDREILQPLVAVIQPDEWRSPATAKLPSYMRTFLHRALMPQIFPEHDVILWVDADAWIQDSDALDAYLDGAAERELCAALELSHLYDPIIFRPAYRRIENETYYERCFGQDAALRYGQFPILNSGVFCMRADSTLWSDWANAIARAWRRTASLKHALTDQTALNLVAYQDRAKVSLLSARYNFMADKGAMLWHAPDRSWRTADASRERIKVVHLSGRKDRFSVVETGTTEGVTSKRSQLYDGGRYLTTTYPERLVNG